MIEAQTEQISNKIDEQTEILIKYMENLENQIDNVEANIVRELETTTFKDLIDTLRGLGTSLRMKKEHIDEYKQSCINDWGEIATESDMNLINFQLGKVASATSRFCASRENMNFCGELLFQYVLISTQRDALRSDLIFVLLNSEFHNKDFKVKAVMEEMKTSREMDRSYLEPILNNIDATDSKTWRYCHIGCAFRGIKNTIMNEYDQKNFTASSLGYSDIQREIVKKYTIEVNSIYFSWMKIKLNYFFFS